MLPPVCSFSLISLVFLVTIFGKMFGQNVRSAILAKHCWDVEVNNQNYLKALKIF